MKNKDIQLKDLDLPDSFLKLCENYSIVTLIQASELINRLLNISANIPSDITVDTLLMVQNKINENLDKENQELLQQPITKYNLDGYKIEGTVRNHTEKHSSGLRNLNDLMKDSDKDKLEEKNDDVY